MSSSDPALSFEEALECELSRFKNVIVEKVEMERVKRERDSLKQEVEELRLKMMESHQTSPFNKSILQDLEQALQAVRKANAALAGAPRVGSSSKVTFPHSSKGSNKEEQGQVCDAAKPSPSTAAGEVITTSDDEDDVGYENRRKRKRSEEAQQASAPAL